MHIHDTKPGLGLANPEFRLAKPGLGLANPEFRLAKPGLGLANPEFWLSNRGCWLAPCVCELTTPSGACRCVPETSRSSSATSYCLHPPHSTGHSTEKQTKSHLSRRKAMIIIRNSE